MFAQYTTREPRRLYGYAAFSVGAHALVIGLLIVIAGAKAKQQLAKVTEVAFIRSKAPPPPPPPPPAAKHTNPVVKKTQIIPAHVDPKPIELPKETPKEEPEEKPQEDKGEEGGQEGGVPGGVQGGVPGGVVGGVVGSDGAASAPLKPKNVPAFKMQADTLAHPTPRLSEVFKQSHKNAGTLLGVYKVCVGMDGHVYEVTVVKSVPGADDDIVSNFKDAWLFKPQQVPVCIIYNMPITVTQ